MGKKFNVNTAFYVVYIGCLLLMLYLWSILRPFGMVAAPYLVWIAWLVGTMAGKSLKDETGYTKILSFMEISIVVCCGYTVRYLIPVFAGFREPISADFDRFLEGVLAVSAIYCFIMYSMLFFPRLWKPVTNAWLDLRSRLYYWGEKRKNR